MANVRDRVKRMVDELPEDVAVQLERLLLELDARRDRTVWTELAVRALGSWYDETEVDYAEIADRM